MITPVDNLNFQGRFHFNGYSKHTPKSIPYKEFYFMPELQKKNLIKEFFNKLVGCFKGLKETRSIQSNSANGENIKEFSTIERNGTGMFFEA